jgi:hypothetical protein
MGLGVGANHRLRDWLDLQLRLLGTFRSSRWHDGEYVNPPRPSASSNDGGHVLAEATARFRPLGPLYTGLGLQAGIRSLGYTECDAFCHFIATGTDTQPVARGLLELGANFGPSEVFDLGLRFAFGSTLGKGPVERDQGTNDYELGFSFGVLLPL